MHIKLGLQRPLILLAVRTATTPLCLEQYPSALRAVGFDWDIAQPFRYPQSWLAHCVTFQSRITNSVSIVTLPTRGIHAHGAVFSSQSWQFIHP